MQKKIDNYSEQNNLNFVLTTYNDTNIETEFKKQDAAIFGKIKDVTNKDKYLEGITLPIDDLKEASLQKYLLGGSSLEIVAKDEKQLLNKYQSLKDNDIGCFNVKRKELPIKQFFYFTLSEDVLDGLIPYLFAKSSFLSIEDLMKYSPSLDSSNDIIP